MNKKTIAKLGLIALVASATTLNSCKKGCTDDTATNYDEKAKKDDGTCEYPVVIDDDTEVVSGKITSNTTWTNDKIYELEGKVVVENNATLTIEKGTIIKGQEGTGTNATALIIARGGKLIANGTAAEPIIFTSVLDNIEMGQLSGTNLDENDRGKWGGLIVLGYAPISAGDGDTESQIEGLPATEAYGTFGGSLPADNSGSMQYISIRHGGALIGAGNEINGLTLGGVGTGTVINHIEVVANLDDGIEFFGGTVDVDNLVIGFQGDDGVDIDMNYSGTVTNFAVVHGIDTDEALEIDGPEGATYTNGLFTLNNGTVKTVDGIGTGADLKSKAQGTINNVSFEGYTAKVLKIRASFTDTVNCVDKSDAYTYLTQTSPILNFTNSEIATTNDIATSVDVYTKSYVVEANDICTSPLETSAENAVANGTSIVGSTNGGADISVFGWTWASIKGKL